MTIYCKQGEKIIIYAGKYRLSHWVSYDLTNRVVWVLARDTPPEIASLGRWEVEQENEKIETIIENDNEKLSKSDIIEKPSYMTSL